MLPSLYGPLDVIGFGEPYATPRGLAEAAGLAGLAASLSNRRFAGLSLCALGMLFHPIMGLCFAAVIGVAMVLEDRRWLWAALAGLVALSVAGMLRLPIADRLVTVMDPAWRAVVEARAPILFPSLWPLETWSRLVVQLCLVAAGAHVLRDGARRLAAAALVAALLGVTIVAVLGDRLSLMLFLQVQTWRTLAPMAILASACLALLAAELPKRGPAGWLALALLATAAMFRDVGDIGLLLAPVGLAFALLGESVRFGRPALISAGAVGLLGLAALIHAALRGFGLAAALGSMPAAWPFSQGLVWSSGLPGAAIALAVGGWVACGARAPRVEYRLAAVALIGLLAALLWDDRSPYVRARDEGRDASLIAMTADRPGEALFLAGDIEPWALMGRASWSSRVQSAGVVFSRPLALELWNRAARLRAAGLASEDWIRPLTLPARRPPAPNAEKVRSFCAAPDAPAWIVWPRWNGAELDPALNARDWTPRAPYVEDAAGPDGRWMVAARYAVIPCAGR
ncbi:hypothetical protein [uncultured Caulobacter sp.]|uniref:hypothetical protein n=1 Tax=uncultured Caulobacter sp. TaxID=158749 RepID=UPI0026399CB6|nr:hypothetical protein [uncultured Caulobacter sp.]